MEVSILQIDFQADFPLSFRMYIGNVSAISDVKQMYFNMTSPIQVEMNILWAYTFNSLFSIVKRNKWKFYPVSKFCYLVINFLWLLGFTDTVINNKTNSHGRNV